MLFHASIDAQNPKHVAAVLAEIWRGTVLDFAPVPGSYIVLAGDERGSAIEVYPAGRVLIDGDAEAESIEAFATPRATATHLAIGVSCSIPELAHRRARVVAQPRLLARRSLPRRRVLDREPRADRVPDAGDAGGVSRGRQPRAAARDLREARRRALAPRAGAAP